MQRQGRHGCHDCRRGSPGRGIAPRRPSVALSFTVDEEYQFAGIRALTSPGPRPFAGLIPRIPDAVIVAEPTGLDVVAGHKGTVRWRCHASGLACHSSKPDEGQNAIYSMARILTALEHYQRHVVAGLAAHPAMGGHTLNVGIICGGSSINIVPDQCSIELEVRFPPGVTPESAQRHVIDYLASALATETTARHDRPYMQGQALPDDANQSLAQRLAAVSREVCGSCRIRTAAYGTNASFFAAAGAPAVVFGPGSIEQAHTDREWIALGQLQQAVEILVAFAKRMAPA